MAVDATAPLPTLTPDSIKRRRLLAELMLKQGMDYSPVQSPWQGAARMVQGLMGGIETGLADKAEAQGIASGNKAMADLIASLGSDSGTTAAAAPASSSSTTPSRALPAFASDVTGGINAATAKYGLDPTYLPVTAAIESRGDPSAQTPRSSAGGLFQFIDGTARQYGLQNKFDPNASADAAARLALDNKKTLVAALGREPTPAELYLAHQQGGAGAARLLANPDAPAASIVGEKAVRLNGGAPGMTAGDFANKWISKFNSVKVPGTQVASSSPTAMTLGYNPANPTPAMTAPYDPNAQPQAGLVQPAGANGIRYRKDASTGGAAVAEPLWGDGTRPEHYQPQPQAAPAPTALPAMAGGGQGGMQMPQQVAQLQPEQIAQAAARPEVQQAAQQVAQTPAGQQMIKQAQGAPLAALMAAMSNPWISDGQKSLLLMLAKDKLDPVRSTVDLGDRFAVMDKAGNIIRTIPKSKDPLDVRLKEAQVKSAEQGLETKPEYKVVGKDPFGNDIYGWVDPRKQSVTPVQVPGSTPQGQSAIPPAPAGVDPKIWREQFSKNAASDALPPDQKDVQSTRKELQDLPSYKNLAQAAPVFKSMSNAANRDNRAADVNMIYGLAKIMDPGSVVRESEMSVAQAIATLPQQLQAQITSQLNATGRLTPELRAQIMEEAHSRVTAYKDMFDLDANMFRGIAQRRRMDPRDIIPDFGTFEPWKPARPAPVPQGAPASEAPRQGGPSPAEVEAEMRRRGLK